VVWWYITFWAHNTSWPIQKHSYTFHIIWSTLVRPNFVKLKGNSKFIRKIWNLSHLAYSLSKMRHRVWRACPSTPNEILMVSHTCYVQVIIRITYKLVRKSRFPFFKPKTKLAHRKAPTTNSTYFCSLLIFLSLTAHFLTSKPDHVYIRHAPGPPLSFNYVLLITPIPKTIHAIVPFLPRSTLIAGVVLWISMATIAVLAIRRHDQHPS
jgi:hypothetical protein